MITAGIIAEYNPFHNGHQFHIEETRRETGADFTIVVMSGNFVQRGAPALLNKFERTLMALKGGADLVLELPVTSVLSSAEGFASGGVCLLENLGVTDFLSFGCETIENQTLFSQISRLLTDEPTAYKIALSKSLKQGMSYPKAREIAVLTYLTHLSPTETSHAHDILSHPNNILGLEYQKAILGCRCRMKICRISRRGNDYNSKDLSSVFSSATAIRHYLLDPSCEDRDIFSALNEKIPPAILPILLSAEGNHAFLQENDFSDLLFYALVEKKNILHLFRPSGADLCGRLNRLLEQFTDWNQFALLLKSKNHTYTAINRYLARILLNIQTADLISAAKYQYAPYARILGFRRTAAPLLKEIHNRSSIPVITQPARASEILDRDRLHLLQLDLNSSEVYNHILYSRSKYRIKSDYRHPMIIV